MNKKKESDYFFEEHFDAEFQADRLGLQGEYESCTFSRIDFKTIDCSGVRFIDCVFEDCDLSMLACKQASFRELTFRNCKLWGLRFDQCKQAMGLSLRFEHCDLRYAVFYHCKAPHTQFLHCNLQEVDFSDCDLTASCFKDCDLQLALFEQSNLASCDFSTARHYIIHPENNKLSKAIFGLSGLPGLLSAYHIEVVPG